MELGVLYQPSLAPEWEPQEVDILGNGRVLVTTPLELHTDVRTNETDPEVLCDGPGIG